LDWIEAQTSQTEHIMNRQTFLVLTAASAVLIIVTALSAKAGGEQDIPAMPDDGLNRLLNDKVVLLEVNESKGLESESDSVLLHKVRLLKIGSRDFFVGVGYAPQEDEDYWYRDMEVGVPCDNVMKFSAMTPAQCDAFLKKWKEQLDQ
jgi:hypothetical protein